MRKLNNVRKLPACEPSQHTARVGMRRERNIAWDREELIWNKNRATGPCDDDPGGNL
jgi:hypothetical protein